MRHARFNAADMEMVTTTYVTHLKNLVESGRSA
jgi:hypothetical protein